MPGFARFHIENAEPAQFDAVALFERLLHGFETVSTAISALVLVMPVRFTTSLMMSQLDQNSLQVQARNSLGSRISQPHDKIEFIPMSSERFPHPGTPVSSEEFRRACGRFARESHCHRGSIPKAPPTVFTVKHALLFGLPGPALISHMHRPRVTTMPALPRRNPLWNQHPGGRPAPPLRITSRAKGHDRFEGGQMDPGRLRRPAESRVLAASNVPSIRIVPMGDHEYSGGRNGQACRPRTAIPLLYSPRLNAQN